MSEFECKNGHLMASGKFKCDICGSRLHRMDGMTAREIARQEAAIDAAYDMYEMEEGDFYEEL